MKTTYPYLIGAVVGIIIAYLYDKYLKPNVPNNSTPNPAPAPFKISDNESPNPATRSPLITQTHVSSDHLQNMAKGAPVSRAGGQFGGK